MNAMVAKRSLRQQDDVRAKTQANFAVQWDYGLNQEAEGDAQQSRLIELRSMIELIGMLFSARVTVTKQVDTQILK
jgi:hypothetical protein